MKKTVLLATLAFFMCLPLGLEVRAASFFKNGNALQADCRSEDAGYTDGVCSGFIIGVLDSNAAKSFYPYCDPDNSNVRQIRDVIKKWLENNPEFRASPAADLVNAALMEAFPPTLRWRTDFRQDADGEWVESKFSFTQTEDAGQWVAYCADDTYTEGAEVWGWSTRLPNPLYERLDTLKYLTGGDQ